MLKGTKEMKKIILNLLFIVYVVIAVFVTVCLLSYNQFKVTEFGSKSFVIVKNNDFAPNYKKGSLVIVDRDVPITNGDNVFFYNTYNQEIEVALSRVAKTEIVTENEKTYTLNGERRISSEYVIGNDKNAKVIGGVGTILNILESRWGFLFIIVLPSLLAFIYQISVVISDLRGLNDKKGSVDEKQQAE